MQTHFFLPLFFRQKRNKHGQVWIFGQFFFDAFFDSGAERKFNFLGSRVAFADYRRRDACVVLQPPLFVEAESAQSVLLIFIAIHGDFISNLYLKLISSEMDEGGLKNY